MNSFFSNKQSILVAMSAILLSATAFADKKNHKKKNKKCVKFVQAGACAGNGSEKRPYNSLAQAQADTSWDTLVVLPSPVVLDGSIILRSGTTLKGTCDPTCGPLSPQQAIITNSNGELNNGNAVVVQGDACIKKLYFKDTWASAINYSNGRNLHVEKVLITGHNQGEVTVQTQISPAISIPVTGIFGQINADGTTNFSRVIIKDNTTGGGIFESSINGTHRKISVNICEIAGIRSLSTESPSIVEQSFGIDFVSSGLGTHHEVSITNSYFHDFRPNADSTVDAEAIELDTFDGGLISACIKNCSFKDIHNNKRQTDHILLSTRGLPQKNSNTVKVKGCRFEEAPANAFQQVTGVASVLQDSSNTITITDNTFVNLYDNIFTSPLTGTTQEQINISGNCGSGINTFFGTVNYGAAKAIIEGTISDNYYSGGQGLGGIGVAVIAPWKKLLIKVERNYLDGQGTGNVGLYGSAFSGTETGPAILDAGCGSLGSKGKNSIVGYFFDVANDTGLTIFARKNWWGQGNPCTAESQCTATQECKKGFCVGPKHVVNEGDGVIHVSMPLSYPPLCPKKCFPTAQHAIDNRTVDVANVKQQHKEALNKKKALLTRRKAW